MPKLIGLHTLFGVLAAVLVGAVLGLLGISGVIQVAFVIVAYVAGAVIAAEFLKKRHAGTGDPGDPEDDGPRFHHFDSRALERLEEERKESRRRDAGTPED
ncbi:MULTISPECIES: hypothetical protein [Arthrobacter]|uniref:Uncharacterized protein n=2 Tax=Arthrobacter TaxID=1663 RepID=A0ABU9KJ87_9MICC|nr:hypothetical protein [Arthrobacter sp. YJM1]MDP5226804.1 hypothetical protein [Arthrobacter sp. YJM1]